MANSPVLPLPSEANKTLVRGGSALWLKSPVKFGLFNAFFGSSAGGTAAALAGNAVDVVTAAGALTANIQIIAAAVDQVFATGNLSADIKLNANAQDTANASGTLTAEVRLNAAAIDVVSANGGLTTQLLASI